MKRQEALVLLLMGAWLLWVPSVYAQATSAGQASTSPAKDNQASIDQSVSLLRQDLRSAKKQTVAATLQLTDAEAAKFWPVYDQYSMEERKIGDQKYALIKEYANGFGTLTNDQALSLTKRALALDDQVTQLRIKYVPIVNQVLPGTKTATFFQIDRRINTLIDLQLGEQIPLVQEQH